MEIIGVNKRHVAVFAFPFASHPSIILSLVRRLASAAPTVVFSFFSTQKANRALFPDGSSQDNIVPYDVSDGIPEECVSTGKPQEDAIQFLAVAEEEFKNGVQAAEKDIGMRISCLLVDAFLIWFSADLAEEMNIPLVAHWIGGAASLSAHFYIDHIRQKYAQLKGPVGADKEIANLIPGLPIVRLGDLPRGVIIGNLESPFETMLLKMGRTLARATVVTLNSFQELDPALTKNLSSMLNNFLNIGPFHLVSTSKLYDQFSCISWLDNQMPGSVAYISFGTVFTPPPHELFELAEALEATKIPFLWSIKKESQKHLPLGFLERATTNGFGKVVSWAPQVKVLEHIATRVFVTHGGWNSVLESIGDGVPMICMPVLGDQQLNAWMIERVWEIGVGIKGENFTKRGICSALEQVLSVGGSSKGRKERTESLKVLAHNAVGPNGSSIENFKTLMVAVTGATIKTFTTKHMV